MNSALARRRTATAAVVLVLLSMFQLVVFGAPPAAGQTEGELQSISAHNVPNGDWTCNSDEWHFVINQIASKDLAPASIVVTFDDAGEVHVPLDKFTGGVAHYTTTANLDATVSSATASIYLGWGGQFNLSHGPCGEESDEWAHITVVKKVLNNDGVQEQFPFSLSTGAEFLLGGGDSKSFDFNLADEESKTVTVSEDVESLDEGWEFVSAECTSTVLNPSAASLLRAQGSSGAGQVTVTLQEGGDYTCTFKNTYTQPLPPPPAPPTPSGNVEKSADPDQGSVVMPGTEIEYTVVVRNDGVVAITERPVIDTLPDYVTVVEDSVSDDGEVSDDGNTITWRVSLAPGASETFTYTGRVADNAPLGASLVNTVEFLTHEDRTTHSVGASSLEIVKAVTPDDGPVEVGDTLTYILTVTAGGNQPQANVVVTDYVPGFDPARPDSGHTTYVEGSAQCLDPGTCLVGEPTADGLITWELGTMAPGTTRQVSFEVTVDDVELEEGQPAANILNAGAVESDQVPSTPSNEVETPVTAVLGDKVGPGDSGGTAVVPVDTGGPADTDTEVAGVKVSSGTLPQTGPGVPVGVALGIATILVLGGAVLMRVVRPRLSKR